MDRETLRLLAITAAVIYAVFQLVHWRRRDELTLDTHSGDV